MDYTDIATVKSYIQSTSGSTSPVESLLTTVITAASRAIDRHCTGVPDAIDYFKYESITNEHLEGQVDNNGNILCYPHKPIVDAVTAFSYYSYTGGPASGSYAVLPASIVADGPAVLVYPTTMALTPPTKVRITISYSGGSGSSLTALPADLVDAATVLAVRFYREAETGMSDAIGIAELGTMTYTKAWPVRVTEDLQPFKRIVGWHHVS